MVLSLEVVSDIQLLSRIREGDAEALDTLLRRYYDTIFAFAFRISGNTHEAEEITQESVLRVARGIRNFRGQSKLTTWFYRITLHCSHDQRRKNQRQEKIKGAKREVEAQEDQTYVLQDKDKDILEALNILSDKEREAMVLTILEDMTHAETAEILKCAETTVSWRVFRAKQKLKSFLLMSSLVK